MDIDYAREYLPFLSHAVTLIVMYACVAVVTGVFVWGAVRRLRTYRSVRGSLWAGLKGDGLAWRPRVVRAVTDIVAQTKVREKRLPAVLHLPIFYGMVLLFLGTLLVLFYEDVLRWFGDFEIRGLFYVLFELVLDLAGLALVIGATIALWRRVVTRPEYLTPKMSTLLVVIGLLFMGLSGFGLEAYRIAAEPNEWAAAAFVGWSLSHLLTGVAEPTGTPTTVYAVFWWLHAGGAFALVAGAAWTGFSHLWVLPANVAAHDPQRPRTKLTTPFDLAAAMESEEDVELVCGTATTDELAAVDRLAADACVACGRCHQECPAQAAGRLLSPRDLVQEIRVALGADAGAHPERKLAGDFEDAVWSCTNCYACEQVCPSRIRHVDYILDFRRALVDQNRLDEQKLGILGALDRNQNPYKLPLHERAAWFADVPYAEEVLFGAASVSEPPEYLYWIGCAAAYDERTAQVARATMDLLRAAGVRFVTLGPAEPCCGEPAKRLGEEGRFQMLALQAIEMVKETGARAVVTHCPHGLNVFLHEYPALGFSIPALHHTELLAQLVASGKLAPTQSADRTAIVYHEPCNLARAGRSSEPAMALLAGAGSQVRLPERHGAATFCCGGGGANSFYQVETEERRISALRLEQLLATGASTIAVSCPFCLTMLRDAAAAHGDPSIDLVDPAEVLLGAVAQPGDAHIASVQDGG